MLQMIRDTRSIVAWWDHFPMPRGRSTFCRATSPSGWLRSSNRSLSARFPPQASELAHSASRPFLGGRLARLVGYALGQLDPPPDLGIVAIAWSLFFENWGIGIRPASLFWHAKVKQAGRLELLQRWSEKHHCMRRRTQNLTCDYAGRSCAWPLAVWRVCLENNVPSEHNCSDTQVDLKYWLAHGWINSTYSM